MSKIEVGLNDNHVLYGDFMIDDGEELLATFDIRNSDIVFRYNRFEDRKLKDIEKFLSRCRGYLAHKSVRDNLIKLKNKKMTERSSNRFDNISWTTVNNGVRSYSTASSGGTRGPPEEEPEVRVPEVPEYG